MGMYTELNVGFRLKDDVPEEILTILNYMSTFGEEKTLNIPLPNHPLFKTTRWSWMFFGDSAYFDNPPHVSFVKDWGGWLLSTTFNIKNYDGEIELFIDWITPYIDAFEGDFLGYQRYEECDLPTLLIHPNTWKEVK